MLYFYENDEIQSLFQKASECYDYGFTEKMVHEVFHKLLKNAKYTLGEKIHYRLQSCTKNNVTYVVDDSPAYPNA